MAHKKSITFAVLGIILGGLFSIPVWQALRGGGSIIAISEPVADIKFTAYYRWTRIWGTQPDLVEIKDLKYDLTWKTAQLAWVQPEARKLSIFDQSSAKLEYTLAKKGGSTVAQSMVQWQMKEGDNAVVFFIRNVKPGTYELTLRLYQLQASPSGPISGGGWQLKDTASFTVVVERP
jgi:uncharacterized membrane protein